MPDKVFLADLNIHYTSLSCDCEIGWVEFWQRKKRQYFCSHQDWTDDDKEVKSQTQIDENCDDFYPDDDLRSVRCSNKNGEPLLEILKTDLECGWSGSSRLTTQNIFTIIAFMITFVSFMV